MKKGLAILLMMAAPAMAQGTRGGALQQASGEELYTQVCQGCHMDKAQGAAGAGIYPALASNARLKSARYALHVVLHGQKAMPWFEDDLNDAQVAAVVNYIRSHFGNAYADSVTADDVKAMR